MSWQLQEAKQKFSEVLDRTLTDGPQVVTRHGRRAAVVLSAEEYDRLTGRTSSFKEFLLGPPYVDDLEIERSKELPREVDLG